MNLKLFGKYVLGYVGVHVLTFLWVRFYCLKKYYKNQPAILKQGKWDPYLRRDLQKFHMIWSFPYYITFWPKFIALWGLALLGALILVLLGMSKNGGD